MSLKLRHTPPIDDHEQQIVDSVDRAVANLERAVRLCQMRSSSRTAKGGSLKNRYRDTSRSLEAVLDMMKGVRGFGPLPQEDADANAQ